MSPIYEDDRHERRVNWPQEIDPEFWFELRAHMSGEEKRMKEGDDRMAQIEEDLKPLKKMYWAILGSGGVAALLLATLLFIYKTDRIIATEMQQAIYRQGTAIEKLIQAHTELEKDFRRDITRVENDVERIKDRPR